jgi:hypothetical protein
MWVLWQVANFSAKTNKKQAYKWQFACSGLILSILIRFDGLVVSIHTVIEIETQLEILLT